MENEYLVAAVAKLERSNVQIDCFARRVSLFLAGSAHEVASKLDTQTDEQIWSFRLKADIPAEFSVIVGEILHNLRSALDQIACAVAMQHQGTTKNTYFPFGKAASIFEKQLAAKGKNLPPEAWDMIRAVRPFQGGNTLLWALHDLNRTDKHIKLVPINLRTSSNNVSYLIIHTGMPLIIGSRTGQHLYISKPRPSAEEIARIPDPTAVYKTPPAGYISFGTAGCTPNESLEFLTTTPNATIETDMTPEFDLALQDVQAFELEPVVAVLRRMRQLTECIVLTFQARFFS